MDTAFSEAVTIRALMASQSKRGLGGLERGGIIPSDVKGGVEVSLFADLRTFEGTESIAKISGVIKTVTSYGAWPTVRTGNGRDKSPKRDRTNHMTRHYS
jgi:hypothetical protein